MQDARTSRAGRAVCSAKTRMREPPSAAPAAATPPGAARPTSRAGADDRQSRHEKGVRRRAFQPWRNFPSDEALEAEFVPFTDAPKWLTSLHFLRSLHQATYKGVSPLTNLSA